MSARSAGSSPRMACLPGIIGIGQFGRLRAIGTGSRFMPKTSVHRCLVLEQVFSPLVLLDLPKSFQSRQIVVPAVFRPVLILRIVPKALVRSGKVADERSMPFWDLFHISAFGHIFSTARFCVLTCRSREWPRRSGSGIHWRIVGLPELVVSRIDLAMQNGVGRSCALVHDGQILPVGTALPSPPASCGSARRRMPIACSRGKWSRPG